MLINIKTSEENKQIVSELTRRLNLGTENIVARIAFAYSLSKNIKLNIEKDLKDSKGKEYKDDILFGKYRDIYIALICQHYGLYKTDKDIAKYIKIHIDNGLDLINKLFINNKNYTGLDFLLENIERGISNLENSDTIIGAVQNNNTNIKKDSFLSPITIKAGNSLDDGSDIHFVPNNISIYNNCHIAVAGGTGTGKTQFALDLLRQFSQISNNNINFIYLDFKGLKKEDVIKYQPFFKNTNSTFIDAPQIPFPINPLSFIDNINDKNKIMGINKFVDIITNYSNIGKKQRLILKDATIEAFQNKKNGEYPNFKDIYNFYIEASGDKPDTLREIIESLSELDIFDSSNKVNDNFLNHNYYLSLSGDLPNSVRFTAIFLIINYIYNTFMNMENAPVENDHVGIRYVLLIDEAHVIFKEKKYQNLLEKILREIRSKGVSVIMLSQGIEEFNQPTFDFSSMCEIVFLLDIKDKKNVKMISKFMGLGDKESVKLSRSMEKIQKGQAISNIKEFSSAELFKINQYHENI
jgi:DNA sulfur modification protein DndE